MPRAPFPLPAASCGILMCTKTRRQLINAISQPPQMAAATPLCAPPSPLSLRCPVPKMRNLLKCQAFYRSSPALLNFYLGSNCSPLLPTCHMLHAACPIAAPSIIVYFGWRQRRRSCWGKWTAIYKNALSCSADNKYEFESAAAALRHAACSSMLHVPLAASGLV